MPDFLSAEVFIAAAWGFAGALLTIAALRWRQKLGRQARLLALRLGPTRAARGPGSRPDVRSWATALGRPFCNPSGARFESLTRLIGGTGLSGRVAPAEIFGWKLLLLSSGLIISLGVCLSSWKAGLLLLSVAALGGWLAPNLWLNYRRRGRLQQILRELPTVIDLLALSLDAGMGLDRAIGIICDRSQSPLTSELQHVLSDIGLGVSRKEAFVRLSERIQSEDVRLLSSSIIQSEQLGSSLVSTVRNQARLLRVARRRRAETQALKAPVKMLFPMVLFILPTLFLVVMGPPALNLARALGQGHP